MTYMRLHRTFALLPPSPCPTRITLRKSSHLLGPKFLQIAWSIDVTTFRVEDFKRNSSSWRLLELGLGDGRGEVAAEEYSHIPATADDVVLGTKHRTGTFASRN
ncbi:uncharacterized protein LOC103960671 isoform X2 [Pyrus x bretschneideri]|uniref:uncharacterized protein LOC103960671 isoform X2 n=1 Tax=Pyrus x bretschneideri TaxID=225117 RepID=UPI00202F9ECF|nr:uncharacterized protein LOC103960671 isoform X2 [Pyrus x bretschneideri]